MGDEQPQTSLFGALLVGGIPLLMGTAALYFTSGVTFRCEGVASGRVACTEGRRMFKLFDVPLRRYPDVRGAVAEERTAYDEDGNPYKKSVPVLLTRDGKAELAPSGAGGSLENVVAQVDAFAKTPTPDGLAFGGQAGGLVFFFHLFSTIFVWSGVWTLAGYLRHLFDRKA